MPAVCPCRFLRLRLVALALGLGWLAGAVRADDKKVMLPAFDYPQPFPSLLAAAGRAGAPIDVKQRPPERRGARAGDAMTFLVALRDGDDLKEWVLVAETADLTEKEAQLPPLKGFHAHTSTGNEVNLGGRRAAIEMTLIGPVTRREADKGEVKPEVKRRRLLVNADYLAIGFDAGCEAILSLRTQAARQAIAAGFATKMAAKPFPPEGVKANQALALQAGFTPEQERGYWSSVPVLLEFVSLVVKTPGLQDILQEVIDVSWWSILSSGGKTKPHVQMIGRRVLEIPLTPDSTVQQYVLPFVLQLNEKPAMACQLIVTTPDAPFGATGGVIGMQVGRPYDKNPQLTVRILATRCRDAAPAAAVGR